MWCGVGRIALMELQIVRRRSAVELAALKMGEFLGYLIVYLIGWAVMGLFALGIVAALVLVAARPDLLPVISGFMRANIQVGIISFTVLSSVSAYLTMVLTNAPHLGAIKGIDY